MVENDKVSESCEMGQHGESESKLWVLYRFSLTDEKLHNSIVITPTFSVMKHIRIYWWFSFSLISQSLVNKLLSLILMNQQRSRMRWVFITDRYNTLNDHDIQECILVLLTNICVYAVLENIRSLNSRMWRGFGHHPGQPSSVFTYQLSHTLTNKTCALFHC